MAIFKAAAMVAEINGSLGGATYRAAPGSPVISARAGRRVTDTPWALMARVDASTIMKAWDKLGTIGKGPWYSAAGSKKAGPGYFWQCMTLQLQTGGVISYAPPVGPAMQISPAASCLIEATTSTVLLDMGAFRLDAASAVVVKSVACLRKSTNPALSSYVYLTYLPGGSDSPWDITRAQKQRWGSLISGSRIWVSLQAVSRATGVFSGSLVLQGLVS